MMSRRFAVVGLSLVGLSALPHGVWAQEILVTESAPAASAVIDGRSSAFFVRFDRPIDHIRSRLAIMRDGTVVEALHPRLEAAPEVLFARAPTLPPGDYMLHWSVRTVAGEKVLQGNIPFSVKP